MTSTPSLFDPQSPPTRAAQVTEGTAARDEAITRAKEHAPASWWDLAWSALRLVASTHAEWTTDEVWALLDDPGTPPVPEPRAMGAVMRRARRAGIAAPTDRTVLSVRPACHRRPVRVWRTL